MRYYYFNPYSKQYFFPEGFQKNVFFENFYKPRKLTAKIVWEIWKKVSVVRNIFSFENINEFISPQLISQLPPDLLVAFNRGTKSIEQKITAIGISTINKESIFVKYAESDIARQNVRNEGFILEQLKHLNFVPSLSKIIEGKNFSLITTNILKGKMLGHPALDDILINLIVTINQQKVLPKTCRTYYCELKTSFAHGDLCPWNMLRENGKIQIFDWEMAGLYPLGYDVFTYIFQIEFLVYKKCRFNYLLVKHENLLSQYFNNWEICDWSPYLVAFANLKVQLESEKRNLPLLSCYIHLKQYAETL